MLFDAISPAQGDGLLRGVLPLLAVFGLLYVISLLFWLLPLRGRRRPGYGVPAHRSEPGFGDANGRTPPSKAD
jgi:hypothetical protein